MSEQQRHNPNRQTAYEDMRNEYLEDLRPLGPELTPAIVDELAHINNMYHDAGVDAYHDSYRDTSNHQSSLREARIAGEMAVNDRIEQLVDEYMHEIEANPDYDGLLNDQLDDLEDRIREAIRLAAEMPTDIWEGQYDRRGNLVGNGVLDELYRTADLNQSAPYTQASGQTYPGSQSGVYQFVPHPSAANPPARGQATVVYPTRTNQPPTPATPPNGNILNQNILQPIGELDLPDNIERLRQHLMSVREAKSQAATDLERVQIWRRSEVTALRARYDELVDEYARLSEQYLHEVNQHCLSLGYTPDTINQFVVDYTNKLANTDIKREHGILIEKGGFSARLMERFANMSRAKKIGFMVGVSAVTAVVGFATGGVGTAAVATAIGLRLTGSARTYALRLSRLYGAKPDIPAYTPEPGATTADVIAGGVDYVAEQSDKSVQEAQKIRLKAIAWTAGSLAVGGAIGITSEVLAGGSGAFGFFEHGTGGGGAANASAVEHVNVAPSDHVASLVEQQGMGTANPNLQDLIQHHMDANGNISIPLHHGDGFSMLQDRYGLTHAQLGKLESIMNHHKGQIYQWSDGPRINYGDGYLHLSAKEAAEVFNAK